MNYQAIALAKQTTPLIPKRIPKMVGHFNFSLYK
ncbi:hypothetical protein J723_4280, partial [Acinetobacter sp. 1264765]